MTLVIPKERKMKNPFRKVGFGELGRIEGDELSRVLGGDGDSGLLLLPLLLLLLPLPLLLLP